MSAARIECPIGATFGGWTVLGEAPPDANGASRWRVKCTCGATCVRMPANVRRGGHCLRCDRMRRRAEQAKARVARGRRRAPRALVGGRS